MKIAIASGKGGTGKTTIATNLACSIARMGEQVQYLDCDVEEPNGHIFLKPDIKETHNATIGVPEVDAGLDGPVVEIDRGKEVSVIGQGDGPAAVLLGGGEQVLETASPVEKAELAVHVKMDEGLDHCIFRCHVSLRISCSGRGLARVPRAEL